MFNWRTNIKHWKVSIIANRDTNTNITTIIIIIIIFHNNNNNGLVLAWVFLWEVKLKLSVLHQAPCHEAVSGSADISPGFLNHDARRKSLASFTLRSHCPRRKSSLDRSLGRTEIRSAHSREKIFHASTGNRTLIPRLSSRYPSHYIERQVQIWKRKWAENIGWECMWKVIISEIRA
jgi:hypothetical protein